MVVVGGETDGDTPHQEKKEPFSKPQPQPQSEQENSSSESDSKYVSIGDVWVFDTLLKIWIELTPPVKI